MEWLNELVDDVVHEGVVDVVRDTVDDVVDTHLQRGAMYDIIMEITTEQILQDGPEIVSKYDNHSCAYFTFVQSVCQYFFFTGMLIFKKILFCIITRLYMYMYMYV